MGVMASQITSLTIVYSTIYSGSDQIKHQSSASLAFVREFTGDRCIPHTKASDEENVPIWWRHHVVFLPMWFTQLLQWHWASGFKESNVSWD